MPSISRGLKSTSNSRGEEVFDWFIFSDLLNLNDPYSSTFFIPPLAIARLLKSSLLLSFLILRGASELGFFCLPVLKSVLLTPLFHPNKRPPSFSFQKPRWDNFVFYFDSHCPSAKEYSSVSFSSAAAHSVALVLNLAEIFYFFWPHQTSTSSLVVS